jgi:hypothetical protein
MSLWDKVSKTYGVEIETSAEAYVKVTNLLPFTVNDLKSVFTPAEMDDVAQFLVELNESKENNQKTADIISKGSKIVMG